MKKSDRRIRRVWLNSIAGISSLIIVALYVADIGFNAGTPAPFLAADSKPAADKIATQFQLTYFNRDGSIDHSLVASRAEFFKQEASLLLEEEIEDGFSILYSTKPQDKSGDVADLYNPTLQFNRSTQSHVTIDANSGEYFPNSGIVSLEGSIKLYDHNSNSNLTTEFLDVHTLQKQVLTEAEVELNNAKSVITARGLSGDLTQQSWKLLDDVKSTVFLNH
jgi:lipopolysaccharide export system protein LptC